MTNSRKKLAMNCVIVVSLIVPATANGQGRRVDDVKTPSRIMDSSEGAVEDASYGRPGKGQPFLPQRSSAVVTLLGGGDSDGLGMTGLNVSTTFARPMPWWHTIFTVTPAFDVQFIDSPDAVALPSELYRASLSLSVMKPISDRTQLVAGITPSFVSDFEASSNALRLMAFAAAAWQWKPTTKLTFGVAATGREDIPILPMAGLTWTPNEDWQIDVAAPRPRIARRVQWFDPCGDDWFYVAGELGGGTWAVDRAGRDDELTIRDFRLVAGFERKATDGLSARFEAGYVFSREIEFENDGFQFEPADTFMVRAGLTF
tara:strand:+ start:17655 stop:18602 length:948 start_codon:yes stop_codon:yes gene_type:complete